MNTQSIDTSNLANHSAQPHAVQFYRQDRELTESLVQFINPALRTGGAVLVIATPIHRAQLEQELGFEAAQARQEGRLVVLDAEQTLSKLIVDGQLERKQFFDEIGTCVAELAKSGNGEVRAFGEMTAVLVADGMKETALELEKLWTELITAQSVPLLCAYPSGLFMNEEDKAAFIEVCETHSHVHPAGKKLHLADLDELLRQMAVLDQKVQARQ